MKNKNIKLVIPIVALLIIGLGAYAFYTLPLQPKNSNPTTLKFNDVVCVGATLNGVYKPVGCQHNTLTGKGKDMLGAQLNGTQLNMNITRIAIANDTVAQAATTDTALSGEYGSSTDKTTGTGTTGCGLINASSTQIWNSNGAWNSTYTWTNTCATAQVVNATGMYNNTNSANGAFTVGGLTLFAETTFTSVTLNQNDQLNVTWGYQITG